MRGSVAPGAQSNVPCGNRHHSRAIRSTERTRICSPFATRRIGPMSRAASGHGGNPDSGRLVSAQSRPETTPTDVGLGAATTLALARRFSMMAVACCYAVLDQVATSCYIESDESGRDQGTQ